MRCFLIVKSVAGAYTAPERRRNDRGLAFAALVRGLRGRWLAASPPTKRKAEEKNR
jgi:hypothetical protein